VAYLVLPSLVVGRGQRGGRGVAEIGDGGDQGDQLILAVAVGDLVLDDADVPGHGGVQVLPGAGSLDDFLPGRGLGLRGD
jgi:hypothetical protein